MRAPGKTRRGVESFRTLSARARRQTRWLTATAYYVSLPHGHPSRYLEDRPIVSMAPGPMKVAKLIRNEVRAQRSRAIPSTLGFTLRGGSTQASGEFEPDEVGFVRRELPACDAFIDVGANVGMYTCLARQAGKPTIAIEPLPDNQRYLCRNLLDNDFSDVSVYPVALGARPGLLTLYGSGTGVSVISGWADAAQRTPRACRDPGLHRQGLKSSRAADAHQGGRRGSGEGRPQGCWGNVGRVSCSHMAG